MNDVLDEENLLTEIEEAIREIKEECKEKIRKLLEEL